MSRTMISAGETGTRFDRQARKVIAVLAVTAFATACGGGTDNLFPDADSGLGTTDNSGDDADGTGSGGDGSGGLSTGTIAPAQTVVPETVEFGEDYNFTMPAGQSQAKFSFEVPAGAVVTLDTSAADSNRGALSPASARPVKASGAHRSTRGRPRVTRTSPTVTEAADGRSISRPSKAT